MSERWDKDIHPSNRFDARWAHPWWDVQSFQKRPDYKENLAEAKDFAKAAVDKWIPALKAKGWLRDEEFVMQKVESFKKALAEHEDFVKRVNDLGNYLAVPISREEKIEKYLPLMKEGGAGQDKMFKEIRHLRSILVSNATGREDDTISKELDKVNLEHRPADPESELYKKMTLEALKVPEAERRKSEADVARWNREYKRSRSKED
jgi:hypothetical protein